MGENLCDLGLSKDFLDKTQKTRTTKGKVDTLNVKI